MIAQGAGSVAGLPAAFIGNLISGNAGDGINIIDSSYDTLEGDVVGLGCAATGPPDGISLGNGGSGVVVGGTGSDTDTIIGGTTGNKGNVIASNGTADLDGNEYGIHLLNTNSPTTFYSNNISTNSAARQNLHEKSYSVFLESGVVALVEENSTLTINIPNGPGSIGGGGTLQLADNVTLNNPQIAANDKFTTTVQATGSNDQLNNVTVNGILDLNGYGATLNTLNGSGTVENSGGLAILTVNGADGTSGGTFSGNITGVTKLAEEGGDLTLTGNNTYSGGTTISNGGTLSISSNSNLGAVPASSATNITINDGTLQATASFTLNSKRGIALGPTSGAGSGTIDVTSGSTLTYAGVITDNGGSGALFKTDGGVLALSGANTYSGGTTVSQGTLSVLPTTASGTYTIESAGTLALGSDDVSPTSQAFPSTFVASNWFGTFSGTARDTSGSGLASEGVSLFSKSHYFDGTAFESNAQVYNAATLDPASGNWTYSIPMRDFIVDASTSVASVALDSRGGTESSTITTLTLAQNQHPVLSASMTAPGNNSVTNNNKPKLSASVSDSFGPGDVASVQFQYSNDGGSNWSNAGPALSTAPFTFTFATALSDGAYAFHATATDREGDSATSSPVSVLIDTVGPTVSMSAPSNNSDTRNNKPTLSATAQDNAGGSGLASVQFQYSNNGGASWTNAGGTETSGPFSFTFPSALADGSYEAHAIATDSSGNSTTSAAVAFFIDTALPTVSMTAPANNSNTNNNKPTLSATAQDNAGGSGLASVQFQYSNNGGTSWTNAGAAETSAPFTFTFPTTLADGSYKAHAIATDNAGNSTTSAAVAFFIDTALPTVSMTAPANNSNTNNNKPTLSATAQDNAGGSGLASVQFQYSSNGGTSWTNAGAAETSAPFTFTFPTTLADGSYEAHAIATDNAGNNTTSAAVSFLVDTTAPTVSMTAPGNGSATNNNMPTLSASVSDINGPSAIASVQFQYSNNGGTIWTNVGSTLTAAPFTFTFVTALSDGGYDFRATATDQKGNSSTSLPVSVLIDTALPTVSMIAPSNNSDTNNNTPTLSATAQDNAGGSGLASVQFQYSNNGGTSWTNAGAAETSGPFAFTLTTALADGSYEAHAIATDSAGNSTTSAAVSFLVDTVGPTVSMTAPANNISTTNNTPTLSATAQDNAGGSGLASVQFQYSSNGGTSWTNAGAAETSGPFAYTLTTALADGSYEAHAIATDSAGNNTTSAAVSFLVDTTAPTVSMTAPGNGSATNNNKPTLSASAQDNVGGSGLASVQFQYSNNGGTSWTNEGAAETNAPFSFTFPTALADGNYEARAVATDNTGNVSTSSAVSFLIDTVAPTVTMSAPANGSATNNNKPTLSATASDNTGGSGLASVQLQYSSDGGGTWNNAGLPETSAPFTFTFPTALADGNYEARAVASDNAGNSATSSALSFLIDTVPPIVTMTAPATSSDTNNNKPTLSATAQDNAGGSSLANVQFQLSGDGGTTWINVGAAETSAPFTFTFPTALADGSYEARAIATDNVGNVATSSAVSFGIDTVLPSSSVQMLPAFSPASFTLNWSGSDNGGGNQIAYFDVYSSDNGGTFTKWLSQTTATTAIFSNTIPGHTYAFYTIATDKAGNVELTPTQAEAITRTVVYQTLLSESAGTPAPPSRRSAHCWAAITATPMAARTPIRALPSSKRPATAPGNTRPTARRGSTSLWFLPPMPCCCRKPINCASCRLAWGRVRPS